jgi:hypothetical protein
MRVFFILCGIILCLSACYDGKPIQDDLPEYNKVKSYNPQKAEAVIVKSFDITKCYFDGGDRLYGETGTGFGPGLFPGPL